MLNIDSITLKNVVTYKDQTFDFQPGLSLVRGENRAGKSLLFSSLSNLLYFSHPLADKKDAKTLLTSKEDSTEDVSKTSKRGESSITLNLSRTENTSKYILKQKASKDTITYQIQENGIDLDSRTIALSKSLIEGIFVQPEDIFFTSTYLTSYRNHPLLHGSTAQRYEFFEKLFNFEFFDYLHEYFNTELKVIESKKTELDNLKSLVLELPNKQDELVKVTEELSKLKQRRDKIQETLSVYTQFRLELIRLLDIQGDLNRTQSTLTNLENSSGQLLSSYKHEFDLTLVIKSKEDLYTSLIEVEKNVKLVENITDELKTYTTKYEQAKANLDSYKTVLNETYISKSIEDLQQEVQKLNTSLAEDNSLLQGKTLDQWKTIYSKAEEVKSLTVQDLNIALEEVQKFTEESVALQVSINQKEQARLEHLLSDINSKLSKIKSLQSNVVTSTSTCTDSNVEINCPTCLSKLSPEQISSYLEDLQKDKQTHTEELVQVESRVTVYNRYLKCLVFMKTAPKLELLEEASVRIQTVKSTLPNLERLISAKRDLSTQQDNVSNTEAKLVSIQASTSTPSTSTEQSSQEVRKLIDSLKTYKKASEDKSNVQDRIKSKLVELDLFINNNLELLKETAGKLTLDTLDVILPKMKLALEDKISSLTGENVGMQTSITNNSVTESLLRKEVLQLEEQRHKITQLQTQCDQASILEKLTKIFHSKGFRLEKIKYFTKVFESTLNKYSSFLFMEPFSFSIVVEKRDLQILATRAGKSSDVRYLSGSESRCFQLLCLISILALMPQSKRTNVCILDEMDAGCDDSTTKMFYESFLPELRNIVPSITVITPLKDNGYYINEDRSYMIRKVDGESTINLLSK